MKFFCFGPEILFLEKIWSQNSKLFKVKFGAETNLNMHICFFHFRLEVPFFAKGASTKNFCHAFVILILFVRTWGWGLFRLTEKSIKRGESYLSIVPNFGPKKMKLVV